MGLARLDVAQTLLPHQQRVVDEKADCDNRLSKLIAFIDTNPTFNSTALIDAERARLRRQRLIMEELSKVLGERIAAFDPEVAQKEALSQLTKEAQSTGEYD